MKKIIPFLLLFSIQYFVTAQSNMQKTGQYSISAQAANSSGNTRKANVITVSPPANYQQSRVTPAYSQSAQKINSNQYVTRNQYVVRSGKGYAKEYTETAEPGKFALNTDFNPVIRNIFFPTAKSANRTVVKKPGVLFNTLSDSGSIIASRPVAPAKMKVERSDKGTTTFINKDSNFIITHSDTKSILNYKYKCVYGNYASCYGPGFYSIHVASFKNLNYVKTVIRYMKNRFKLDAFVFYDLSSVNTRYHLVIGKYRHYFLADNILRVVRKEMPNAFVINWSQYSWMIIFE